MAEKKTTRPGRPPQRHLVATGRSPGSRVGFPGGSPSRAWAQWLLIRLKKSKDGLFRRSKKTSLTVAGAAPALPVRAHRLPVSFHGQASMENLKR